MKEYFRSVGGKTLLIIICVMSAFLMTAGAIGAVIMLDNGYVYRHTEEYLQEEARQERMQSDLRTHVWFAVSDHNGTYHDGRYIYQVKDAEGRVIAGYEDPEVDLDEGPETYTYAVIKNDANGIEEVFYIDNAQVSYPQGVQIYTVSAVPTEETSMEYAQIRTLVHAVYSIRYTIYPLVLLCAFAAIFSFVGLMCAAGHRPGSDEVVPGMLERIPYDIFLMLYISAVVAGVLIIDEIVYGPDPFTIGISALIIVAEAVLFIWASMSTAVRIKLRVLFSFTFTWKCLKLIHRILKKAGHLIVALFRSIPLVWKTAAIMAGAFFIQFLILVSIAYDGWTIVALCTWEMIIVYPFGIYIAVCLKKLQAGGRALAAGDLSHITDTKGMFGELRAHGEDLNNIAAGMSRAVEERMKSERMKTELITNVSHDIKTPLTSIINYAALIDQQEGVPDNVREYSAVLVRQSERLKRLLEDLIEASKAATGNLDVAPAPCDASVFIEQAAGEYEEKLAASQLTLVTRYPEEPVMIMADGRRMWRIFDNLMNNICKYAQPGTRVYLALEKSGGQAQISFRNISQAPLDMTEEELMERFTRGDSSRHAEGNGLGLSIARSLAQLQGGELRLYIDGDLFKAVLTFPLI